jgi:CubicO group peptidase (beta-lactamase class C family)
MRALPFSPLAILVMAALFVGEAVAAQGDAAFPLMTMHAQNWVDRGYYPGCSIWIAKGDRVLYEKSFGDATPDAEVFIASAGKWLSAAAILAVVDDGKLSLDDPAVKWLPEFGDDPKGKATLRQMFAHTTGYPPLSTER